MKRLSMRISVACLLVGCLYCALQTKGQNLEAQANGGQSKASPKSSQSSSQPSSEGEIRFEAHCGRCHNPPEDLSPRKARAVLRQMRVRAMLSAEDEQLILRYVAP